jgi:hypothetical protein
VLLRVDPQEPVIQPRVTPVEPVATSATDATAAERRMMQPHDVCYPGYRQEFKYRGVWHWRCRYN